MLTKIYEKINLQCDGCDEVLDCGTEDFDAAKKTWEEAGWTSHKERGDKPGTRVWNHYCPKCST